MLLKIVLRIGFKRKTKLKKTFNKYDKFDFKEYLKLIKDVRKNYLLTTLTQTSTLYSKFLSLFKIASADITNVPLLKYYKNLFYCQQNEPNR